MSFFANMDIYQGVSYLYLREGQQFGPVDGARLLDLAESGQIFATDHIWTEGMGEWLPMDSVNQFAALFAAQRGTAGFGSSPFQGGAPAFGDGRPVNSGSLRKLRDQDRRRRLRERKERRRMEFARMREEERREKERQREMAKRLRRLRSRYPGIKAVRLLVVLLFLVFFTGTAFYFDLLETGSQTHSFGSLEEFAAFDYEGDAEFSRYEMGRLVMGILAGMAAVLYLFLFLRFVYRSWKYLQELRGVTTTPARAAGFLLIPLFNLLWLDTVTRRWEEDFQRQVDHLESDTAPELRGWLFRLPRLFMVLLFPLIHLPLLSEMGRGVNFLAEERIRRELEEEAASDRGGRDGGNAPSAARRSPVKERPTSPASA